MDRIKKFVFGISALLLAGSLFAANLEDTQNEILQKTQINNLQVRSEGNTVYLAGQTGLLENKLEAERIARDNLKGAVVNEIEVMPNQKSDQDITLEVVANIKKDSPRSFLFNSISVKTNNGNVTLLGQVRDAYLVDVAKNAAAKVSGARSVTSQIEILPASPSDDRLRIAIIRKLYADGLLSRYLVGHTPSINVVVEGGRVTLLGYVNSEVDRRMASVLVREMIGVISVDNLLQRE